MTLAVELRSFDGRLNRAEFDSGVPALDEWLRLHAGQHEKRGTSRTYVLTPARVDLDAWSAAGFAVTEDSILGFFSLSAAQIPLPSLPAGSRLPRSVAAARLGRLAISKSMQGRGLGRRLLMEAIVITAEASALLGIGGLFVDAKDDVAAGFYQKFGFQPGQDDPHKLWMNLASIHAFMK